MSQNQTVCLLKRRNIYEEKETCSRNPTQLFCFHLDVGDIGQMRVVFSITKLKMFLFGLMKKIIPG